MFKFIKHLKGENFSKLINLELLSTGQKISTVLLIVVTIFGAIFKFSISALIILAVAAWATLENFYETNKDDLDGPDKLDLL